MAIPDVTVSSQPYFSMKLSVISPVQQQRRYAPAETERKRKDAARAVESGKSMVRNVVLSILVWVIGGNQVLKCFYRR